MQEVIDYRTVDVGSIIESLDTKLSVLESTHEVDFVLDNIYQYKNYFERGFNAEAAQTPVFTSLNFGGDYDMGFLVPAADFFDVHLTHNRTDDGNTISFDFVGGTLSIFLLVGAITFLLCRSDRQEYAEFMGKKAAKREDRSQLKFFQRYAEKK